MTLSIRDTLAVLPSGKRYTSAISWGEVSQYLRDNCDRDEDKAREARHVLRDQMYRDGGCEHMCAVIDDVFKDPNVAQLRKKWVRHARFSNPLKRTVNELSTVYQRNAIRSVAGDVDQTRYRDLLDTVSMDAHALHCGRMLTLHRTILLGFRVKLHADGTRRPVAYCVTPSSFRPVLDPSDDQHVLGWLIRTGYRPAGVVGHSHAGVDAPAWVLWTNHEQKLLRADMSVIGTDDAADEHGLGLAPVVPVTMNPCEAGFWSGDDGEDLVAARTAVWMTNVLMLKETKSATKMPIVSGDTSRAARDAMHDTEGILEVGEGAAFTTVDNSMDLGAYQKVSDHITDSSAGNYGLSSSMMRNEGVQSADARDLQRIPLNELRDQQRIPWRKAERAYVHVMAVVCASDLPELAFSDAGFRIDFDEGATPLGQADDLTIHERKTTANLDNPYSYLMRKNPDMTLDDARAEVAMNIEVNTEVQRLTRPMNAISGADKGGSPAVDPMAADAADAPVVGAACCDACGGSCVDPNGRACKACGGTGSVAS